MNKVRLRVSNDQTKVKTFNDRYVVERFLLFSNSKKYKIMAKVSAAEQPAFIE